MLSTHLTRVSVGVFALALIAACGNPKTAANDEKAKPTTAEQADALAAKPADGGKTADAEDKKNQNLSQELLDKLKSTASEEEAARLEEEIWDAWMVSGSGTVDVLMKRGLDYQEGEDLDGAREMFDRIIAIKPDYAVDVLMKRGLDYQEGEDLDGAREMFDRIIAIKPDYAEAWNRRALLFFNDGKYDEAVADLESTLIYEPRHFGAWIGLGMIFESIERPEAALLAYRKALEIHPHAETAKQGEKRLIRMVEGLPI